MSTYWERKAPTPESEVSTSKMNCFCWSWCTKTRAELKLYISFWNVSSSSAVYTNDPHSYWLVLTFGHTGQVQVQNDQTDHKKDSFNLVLSSYSSGASLAWLSCIGPSEWPIKELKVLCWKWKSGRTKRQNREGNYSQRKAETCSSIPCFVHIGDCLH